jgi:hypothetical protein
MDNPEISAILRTQHRNEKNKTKNTTEKNKIKKYEPHKYI